MSIEQIIKKQRDFFEMGQTKDPGFRIDALRKLRSTTIKYEQKIYSALKADLNKSEFESYMTEVGMVLDELRFAIRHMNKWAKRQSVSTPLAQFHSRSFKVPEPYGIALIMAPWNYPFQLSFAPLIGAIAAGNCAVLKPSEYAPATSQALADIVSECFSPEHITVVQGAVKESEELLQQRFDFIFFTGGIEIGKIVMRSASENLTPVCLELGGKSPCIVDKRADLKTAARRIAFGKLLNAGQTCVAPDYLMVHSSVKDKLVEYIKQEITSFYGDNPLENEDYPKIINEKHYNRLIGLVKHEHVLLGGQGNKRGQIAPTLIDGITGDSPIMREEIFGPILPIITFERLDEVIDFVSGREKPLALYLFTNDKSVQDRVLSSLSFGGGCINDTIIHLATPYMGFGGVGMSGMGSYHGKQSFDTFSHYKSIVKKYNWIDLPMRYFPASESKLKMIKWFLR